MENGVYPSDSSLERLRDEVIEDADREQKSVKGDGQKTKPKSDSTEKENEPNPEE